MVRFLLILGLFALGAPAFARAPRLEIRFDGDTLTPFANTVDLIQGVVSTLRDDHGTVTVRGYVDASTKAPGLDYLFEQRVRLIEGLLSEWMVENPGWKFAPAILSDNFSEHSRSFEGSDEDLMVVEIEFKEARPDSVPLKIRKPAASDAAPYEEQGKVTITYAPTSTRLYPGGQQEILAAMGGHRKGKLFVRVTGYAHREGKSERALKLSQARAKQVVEFLRGVGLPPDRFLVVAGKEDHSGQGGARARRVEVEFLTEREFEEIREVAAEPAPAPTPCPPQLAIEKIPEEKIWFGTFGLASALDYYNFIIGLEHALGSYASMGLSLFGQSSTKAGYAGKSHGLAAALNVNFYSRENWSGIWIRFAGVYHMTTTNDVGTTRDFLPGIRFNLGYVLMPHETIRLRLSTGFQNVSEGQFKNVFGGFTPFIQMEMGVPW